MDTNYFDIIIISPNLLVEFVAIWPFCAVTLKTHVSHLLVETALIKLQPMWVKTLIERLYNLHSFFLFRAPPDEDGEGPYSNHFVHPSVCPSVMISCPLSISEIL